MAVAERDGDSSKPEQPHQGHFGEFNCLPAYTVFITAQGARQSMSANLLIIRYECSITLLQYINKKGGGIIY